MAEIDDTALAAALADACFKARERSDGGIVAVAAVLRTAASGEEDPLLSIVAGLEYHFLLPDERRDSKGPFGPMIEMNGQSYPAPVDRVEEMAPGTYSLWERAAQVAPLSLVRARFADLLWEGKYGDRRHEFAQLAIDSYIEALAEGFGHHVDLSEAIRRAIELASLLSDDERRARAIDAAVGLVDVALASDDRMPGVALPLLAAFVEDRPGRRPARLDDLIEGAIERFGDDPWILEPALELQVKLAERKDRDALRTRSVEAFRDLAHESQGLRKYALLQHAIEIAEANQLKILATEFRREVEAMSEEDFGLQTFSAEVSLPRDRVDAFISLFVGDDDIESALARFGHHEVTGDTDENRQVVQQMMTDHPLSYLVTKLRIGTANSLLSSTAGLDGQADQALIDHESERASIFSIFAVQILDEIASRYGPIATSAAAWFEGGLIERAVAMKIVRAIELYEAGDYDSAASVLAPRLERVVRRLAGAVGIPVSRGPDRGGRSGGVRGLAELLGALKGALPEPTRRYLRVLLIEVTGLNLRNRIGHGLDDGIAQREAALLIQCACLFRILVPDEGPAEGAS